MLVEFYGREPGSHPLLATVEMQCVPRVDERVTLDGNMSHLVHEVLYDVSDLNCFVARVLLRI